MAYKNISGTTMPTFKLRNGRLELISAVLKQEDGTKVDQFKIKDSTGNAYKIADERDIGIINKHIDEFDRRFDTVIEGSRIKKMSYKTVAGEKVVTIVITDEEGKNPEEIVLPTTTSTNIFTPETTEVGEIVLYGSTDGKTLKNSGLTIADSASDLDDEGKNTIPTSKAVREYIGGASASLGERLSGNNVTDFGTVLPD